MTETDSTQTAADPVRTDPSRDAINSVAGFVFQFAKAIELCLNEPAVPVYVESFEDIVSVGPEGARYVQIKHRQGNFSLTSKPSLEMLARWFQVHCEEPEARFVFVSTQPAGLLANRSAAFQRYLEGSSHDDVGVIRLALLELPEVKYSALNELLVDPNRFEDFWMTIDWQLASSPLSTTISDLQYRIARRIRSRTQDAYGTLCSWLGATALAATDKDIRGRKVSLEYLSQLSENPIAKALAQSLPPLKSPWSRGAFWIIALVLVCPVIWVYCQNGETWHYQAWSKDRLELLNSIREVQAQPISTLQVVVIGERSLGLENLSDERLSVIACKPLVKYFWYWASVNQGGDTSRRMHVLTHPVTGGVVFSQKIARIDLTLAPRAKAELPIEYKHWLTNLEPMRHSVREGRHTGLPTANGPHAQPCGVIIVQLDLSWQSHSSHSISSSRSLIHYNECGEHRYGVFSSGSIPESTLAMLFFPLLQAHDF